MIAEILSQMPDLNVSQLIPQVGLGGILVLVIVKWLQRVETGLEKLEHTMRGLSKAIWLDLADRSPPGSFVREEAKRTVERMKATEQRGE